MICFYKIVRKNGEKAISDLLEVAVYPSNVTSTKGHWTFLVWPKIFYPSLLVINFNNSQASLLWPHSMHFAEMTG